MSQDKREFKAGLDGRTARRDGRMDNLRKRRQGKLERRRKQSAAALSGTLIKEMVQKLSFDSPQYVSQLRKILGQGDEATPYFHVLFNDPNVVKNLVATLDQPLTTENAQVLCDVAACIANISAYEVSNEWIPVMIGYNLLELLSKHLSVNYNHTDFYDSLIITVGNICFDTQQARDYVFNHNIIILLSLHFDDNIELQPALIDCFNSLFQFNPIPPPSSIGEFWMKIRPIIFQSETYGIMRSINTMISKQDYKAIFIKDDQLLKQLVNILSNPNTHWNTRKEILCIFNMLSFFDLQYMIQNYNVIDLFSDGTMHDNPNVVEIAADGLANCVNDGGGQNYKLYCSPYIYDNLKNTMTRNNVWRIKKHLMWTLGFILQNAAFHNDQDAVLGLCGDKMLYRLTEALSTQDKKLQRHILITVKELVSRYPFVVGYLEVACALGTIEEVALTHNDDCSHVAEQILAIIDGKPEMDLEEEEVPDYFEF